GGVEKKLYEISFGGRGFRDPPIAIDDPPPPIPRTARGILTSGKPISTTDGTAMIDGTATMDDEGITAGGMTGMTIGAMFVMTTGGITTSRRFDRISKIFAMHAMKSTKAAKSCAGIIRS